jgi:hypothetical protein
MLTEGSQKDCQKRIPLHLPWSLTMSVEGTVSLTASWRPSGMFPNCPQWLTRSGWKTKLSDLVQTEQNEGGRGNSTKIPGMATVTLMRSSEKDL